MIEKIARKANLVRYSLRARAAQATSGGDVGRALACIARDGSWRKKRLKPGFWSSIVTGAARFRREPAIPGAGPEEDQSCLVVAAAGGQRDLLPVLRGGLPIPDLYAIYFRRTPGYCPQGTPLYDSQQWARFIATSLPSEFVVKPCDRYRGTGVMGFTRTGPDGFLGSDRMAVTSRQIVDSLRHSREAESFVIQQRLRSHHALTALSQNPNLQTLRITTFIDRRMKCRILFSHLKLMTLRTSSPTTSATAAAAISPT